MSQDSDFVVDISAFPSLDWMSLRNIRDTFVSKANARSVSDTPENLREVGRYYIGVVRHYIKEWCLVHSFRYKEGFVCHVLSVLLQFRMAEMGYTKEQCYRVLDDDLSADMLSELNIMSSREFQEELGDDGIYLPGHMAE